MTTTAPGDLLTARAHLMAATGITDPVAVGIVGDAAHAARGGYHISPDDIANAGKFGEYSTRLARDRNRPDPYASALDLDLDWPVGGRAAALRFNNNVAWELAHNPGNLPGLRAVNYTPDGDIKLRYDREHPDGPTASTDTVTIHTHLEWYRDTRGNRDACIDRLTDHVLIAQGRYTGAAAPPPAPQIEEADMIYTVTGVPANTTDFAGTTIPENGQCVATPSGPFALTGSEFFSLPASAQAVRITMPYARLVKLCNGMKGAPSQATLTPEQFSDFKASAVPIVHDAAQTGAADGIIAQLDGATIHVAQPDL